MSGVLLAVAIDDWGLGPLAAKEAAVMRLEPLGGVRVLTVEGREDEQLGLEGMSHARPATSPSRPRRDNGQAQSGTAGRSKRSAPNRAIGCFNCAHYRKDPGWDDAGQGFYGRCVKSGRRVYKLFDLCERWADERQ